MFTEDQIKAAHSKVNSGADFPNYVQDLIKLGVTKYESFVIDGHTNYYGKDDFQLTSIAKYPSLPISNISNKEQFVIDLKNHQNGKTDYPTFCKDCAKSGVEKWVIDTHKMSCIYYDKTNVAMLKKLIPN